MTVKSLFSASDFCSFVFFFFSSRRRHTRCGRDWSSDVCSSDLDYAMFADAVAPGIVLAQAIGRWGNYFNQELFGTPSKLPWALEIAPAKRPAGYLQYSTFHPTFLYESLYCLAVFGVLIWVSRRFRLYRGQ